MRYAQKNELGYSNVNARSQLVIRSAEHAWLGELHCAASTHSFRVQRMPDLVVGVTAGTLVRLDHQNTPADTTRKRSPGNVVRRAIVFINRAVSNSL